MGKCGVEGRSKHPSIITLLQQNRIPTLATSCMSFQTDSSCIATSSDGFLRNTNSDKLPSLPHLHSLYYTTPVQTPYLASRRMPHAVTSGHVTFDNIIDASEVGIVRGTRELRQQNAGSWNVREIQWDTKVKEGQAFSRAYLRKGRCSDVAR